MTNNNMTGYPSIDKPWMKYYSEEEKNLKVPEGSMFDYLYSKNASYLNDIAIEYYGRTFTYQELFEYIEKCCRNLTAAGIKKGDIVTIQAIPLPQIAVIIYALTRIGACGNMLYPDAKAKDVVASMEKTKSRLLIVVDKILSTYEEELPESFDHKIVLLNVADQMSLLPRIIIWRKAAYSKKNKRLNTISWNDFIRDKGLDYQENHDGEIPAFMLRTGGTTGIPKEVVLSSRNFNAIAEGTYLSRISACWKRQKTSLLLQPPFIAFGIGSGFHHSLSFGIRLIISLDVSPIAVKKLLLKYKPNYIIAGTLQIEQFMNDTKQKNINLNHIDLLAVGGEALNAAYEEKLLAFLHKHHCYTRPIKGYGLTETAATVVAETIHAYKSGSVGIPIGLVNVKIIDPDTNEELSYNTAGEICLSSPGIMQGYYQDPEATKEVIEIIDGEKWLHTGDIGMVSEDGMLSITGRIKRIIVCKEGIMYHKVFPLLIEDKLSKISGVKEISIVGRPDKNAGNILIAYVVPENKDVFDQTVERLKKYCDTCLESFERPSEYIYSEELPRTLIGKVDYRKLEKMAYHSV